MPEKRKKKPTNPRVFSHFETVDHMDLSNTTRMWNPTRLVIRDAQRHIQRAECERHKLTILRERMAKSRDKLESIVLDICKGL